MAIAQDASTPADVKLTVSTSATGVTPSFTPPAGSLVVISVNIGFNANTPTSPTFTVADSGSTSYTAGPTAYDGGASGAWLFWHYYATAPSAITVTATRTVSTGAAMFYVKTWVLTGAAAAQTGAASTSAHAQTGTPMTKAITPTVLNSWVMASLGCGSNLTFAASNLTQDANWADASDGEGTAAGHAVTAALSSETIGWTVAGNSTAFWSLALLEILPAGGTTAVMLPQQRGRTRRHRRQQMTGLAPSGSFEGWGQPL